VNSPIYYPNIVQGSDEWRELKAGKWSASKAAVIMGGLDTGGLADLIQDIAWERCYGPITGGFKSKAMERGNEMEPESRDWYCFEKMVAVEEVGFVRHHALEHVGWSPDGLIGAKGGIECKNPLHRGWMEVKRTGKIPSQYRWQTKWAFWVGQLDMLDFVAYDPRAGGLIIPATVTDEEKERMEERVDLLEGKVSKWIEIILNDEKNHGSGKG
jgi:hypothetical protein